jgi:hypothetical protein
LEKLNDPSGAMSFLLMQLLSVDKKVTSAELLASPFIKKWHVALALDPPVVQIPTKMEMMPFIALLHDTSVPARLRMITFKRLEPFLQNDGHTQVMVEQGFVQACVKHLRDTATGLGEDPGLIALLLALAAHGGGIPDDAIMGHLLEAGSTLQTRALRSLHSMLNRNPQSFFASRAILSILNITEELWGLVTIEDPSNIMVVCGILSLLFVHPNCGRAFTKNHSLDYRMLQILRTNKPMFVGVFEDLREPCLGFPNRLFLAFLTAVQMRKSVFPSIRDILRSGTPGVYLSLCLEGRPVFSRLVAQSLKSPDVDSDFFRSLIDCCISTVVFGELVKACSSSGTCTKLITYDCFTISQPLLLCLNCKESVCLSCVRTCHKGHLVSAMFAARSNHGHCECQCQVQARPIYQWFTRLDPPLLVEPFLEDEDQLANTFDLSYWVDTGILESRCRAPRTFRSKGFKFEISGNESTSFYFEVCILDEEPIGTEPKLVVGLATQKDAQKDKLVGDSTGLGYQSNGTLGIVSGGNKQVKQAGPVFGMGDTVGCGVRADGVCYFTRNGCFVGAGGKAEPNALLFATVSGAQLKFKLRFCFQSPFSFEPNVMKAPSVEQVTPLIEQVSPEVAQALLGGLVEYSPMDAMGFEDKNDDEAQVAALATWADLAKRLQLCSPDTIAGILWLMNLFDRRRATHVWSSLPSALQTTVKESKGASVFTPMPVLAEAQAEKVSPVLSAKTLPVEDPSAFLGSGRQRQVSVVSRAESVSAERPPRAPDDAPAPAASMSKQELVSLVQALIESQKMEPKVTTSMRQSTTRSTRLFPILIRANKDKRVHELVITPGMTFAELRQKAQDLLGLKAIKKVEKMVNGQGISIASDHSVAVLRENDSLVFFD